MCICLNYRLPIGSVGRNVLEEDEDIINVNLEPDQCAHLPPFLTRAYRLGAQNLMKYKLDI